MAKVLNRIFALACSAQIDPEADIIVCSDLSFPDPSVRSDQIFDHLEIEKQVYDSCANGKNLTLFSLENKQSTKGLS